MNRMAPQDAGWTEPEGLDQGLWFIPLGGAGEIGMNMNLFACDGRWLMVDCGVTFGDDSIPGIDVVMPDPSFIADRRDKLDGLVITHAHEDHLGAVAYLWRELRCPVYATPFAAEFLEAKLAETGLTGQVPIKVLPLGGKATIGPFNIEFIALTHSIPEPNALAIRTRHGTLFHTGDWKFDPEPLVGDVTDYAKLQALGDEDVLALIGDSTNVFTEGEAGSEREVRDTLVKLFARQTGRIVVGCFASNVARLESIAHAAATSGRHVALVGASLWRIVNTARKTGYLSPDLKFYEAEEAAHLPRHEVAYICTGSQGEGRAALMRIAFGQHPDVALEPGDVAIFSSRVIPGNEQAVHKVQNQLIRLGVELVTWRDEHIHVSGHPAREELRRMYGLIRPRIAVPVHGELMHMNAHAKLALECQVPQAVRLENGQALKFADGRAQVMGSVWAGRWAWFDGEAVPLNDPAMKERKRLLYDGAAVVSLALDEDGQLTDEPQISLLGIGDPLAEERDRGWEWVLSNAVERLPKKARRDDAAVEEAVRSAVRKVFVPMGRKPLIKVHIAAA
ncbi:MAG: ribonuclease J [Rhodospirillaceae bacterium]|nr:ribonuclease J [Rhodospirillaceae bacterium]